MRSRLRRSRSRTKGWSSMTITTNARVWGLRLLTVAIAAVAAVALNAQARATQRPYVASNFALELDGQALAWLKSIEGGSVETEVIEFQDGNNQDQVRKLPGRTRFANI